MKIYIIGIIGSILLALGIRLIALQIREGDKTIVGSIASGFMPVFMGILLLGLTVRLKQKTATIDQ